MAIIKTTGAQIKAFWDSEDPRFWPEGSHVDCMFWVINGVQRDEYVAPEGLQDTDRVEVFGLIVHADDKTRDFAGVMRKWLEEQTHEIVMISVPKDKMEETMLLLKQQGVRRVR